MTNYVLGSISETAEELTKKGIRLSVSNNIKTQLIDIPVDLLNPMDSQRYAKSDWAKKKLADRDNNLDWLAFGTLSVALTPEGEYHVFDGCGRWLIAQLYAEQKGIPLSKMKVPCVVFEMTKAQAAFYFAYNQSKGRRSLSKEVIFVSSYYGGDLEAIELADVLKYVGAFVKGDCLRSVPEPVIAGTSQMKFRTINDGYYKIANKDKDMCRLAKDLIYNAFASADGNCDSIQQDLYWAVLQSLIDNTVLHNGQGLTEFRTWLTKRAEDVTQVQFAKDWKGEAVGLTGNVGISKILAYNLLKGFKTSKQISAKIKKAIPNKDPLA